MRSKVLASGFIVRLVSDAAQFHLSGSVYQVLSHLPEIQLIYSRRIMDKFRKQNLWQAGACLFCTGVLWIHLDAFGGSEFSGGHITGKLFTMAELACLLFSVALLSTIFFPRVAAAIVLASTLLCLPFYLYILMPGPYRHIFKGEYAVPLQRSFAWNSWAVVGVLGILVATFSSLYSLSKGRPRLVR